MAIERSQTLEDLNSMSKEIDKVVIFFKDGTFSEIKNVVPVKEFNDRPVPTQEFPYTTLSIPCPKCGMAKTPCFVQDCPTGLGWPGIGPTVVD